VTGNGRAAEMVVKDGADGARSAAAKRVRAVLATVGGVAVVYSRSPALNHHALADIEWLIWPAVLNGQCHVVEATNDQTGYLEPIAATTWAFVSPEVDARLSAEFSRRIRLRPHEWNCAEIGWIVDWADDPPGVAAAIAWLKAGPFKDRSAKIVVRELSGLARITTLDDVAAAFHQQACT
jgi:hemolysin-activating ACP:hemolysin acyltransferase